MTGWIGVVNSADVRPGEIVEVGTDSDLIVWRTMSGVVCVTDARCPHQWSHLASQGVVDGEELVCLTHMWRFDVDGQGCRATQAGDRETMIEIHTVRAIERDGVICIRR